MKKILSGALTAALLTSLLTVAASAITTNEITIKGVEQLPTIDGKVSMTRQKAGAIPLPISAGTL